MITKFYGFILFKIFKKNITIKNGREHVKQIWKGNPKKTDSTFTFCKKSTTKTKQSPFF